MCYKICIQAEENHFYTGQSISHYDVAIIILFLSMIFPLCPLLIATFRNVLPKAIMVKLKAIAETVLIFKSDSVNFNDDLGLIQNLKCLLNPYQDTLPLQVILVGE